MSARKKGDSGREKCRLCQSDTDLVDVFDKNIYDSKHLRTFILVTSGVEILETDIVSKKVCHRCCIIAVKSYKYRYNAVETDKVLKKESGQEYVAPVLPNILGLDVPTTKKSRSECDASVQTDVVFENPPQNRQICSTNHKSVNKMLRTSKTIIVPRGILRDNISPVIVLDKDQTERYLRKNGKDVNEEINQCLHTLSLMDEPNFKHTTTEEPEPSTSRILNRITFSDAKAIHDLIPKEPSRPQVSRKRTSTQPLSSLLPPKRQKLHVITENSDSLDPPVTYSDDKITPRRSPSPNQLLEPKRNDEIFECKVCQQIFDRKIMMYHHMKVHLKCKLCKEKFKSTDDFDEHLNSNCYLSIAKNLPSIKLTKVDEIESMKKIYPQLLQKHSEDDVKVELSTEDEMEEKETDDPTDNSDDSNGINLKSMLESAPTVKDVSSQNENTVVTTENPSPPSETIINIETTKISEPNEDIINIDDDSDEDPTYMPTTSKAKSSTVPSHSVSVIHPEIDVQFNHNALVNNVTGKCKAHNLIVSLFEKYSQINRVDTGAMTDYIPDASCIQSLGTQTNLLNLASELNLWKIPVVLRKHPRVHVSFVWHKMHNKKAAKASIDWSHIKPIGIVPVKKQVEKKVVSVTPKNIKVVAPNQMNKSVTPPVIANKTLTVPTIPPTLPNDLLAIPTNTLYQTGPTSFTLAAPEPITNNILIQPNIYGQSCVINSTNQISNGTNNFIVTSLPETSTTLVTTPYFIAKSMENHSTFTPVQTVGSMPNLSSNSPVSNNTTAQNNPPNEPVTLPKYPLLRVRTNLH